MKSVAIRNPCLQQRNGKQREIRIRTDNRTTATHQFRDVAVVCRNDRNAGGHGFQDNQGLRLMRVSRGK